MIGNSLFCCSNLLFSYLGLYIVFGLIISCMLCIVTFCNVLNLNLELQMDTQMIWGSFHKKRKISVVVISYAKTMLFYTKMSSIERMINRN